MKSDNGNDDGRDTPVYMKDLKPEYREHFARLFTATGATLTESVMSWGFETIKHLALINAAGLAGAAALYSVPAVQKAASAALPWFLVGLVVTILTMSMVYVGGLIYTASYHRKMMMVLTDQAPISSAKTSVWVQSAVAVNWLAVLATLGLFLIGVYKLVSGA